MQDNIQQYLHYLRIEKNASPKTIQLYERDLLRFNAHCLKPISQVDKNDIRSFLVTISMHNTEVTRSRKLSCLRSFFKFAVNENLIDMNPAQKIENPKLPQREPSFLTETEYQTLLTMVRRYNTPFYRDRDTAIIYLFLGSGIRVNELVNLTLNDIDLIDGTIKVIRKGNKEQIIPINKDVVNALRKYIKARPDLPFPQLFISKKKSVMRTNTVYHLVRKYFTKANIHKRKMGCHVLRHTFCTSLLNKGVNLVAIQELAGHKNLETTRRYLHIHADDLRKAVNQIKLSSNLPTPITE